MELKLMMKDEGARVPVRQFAISSLIDPIVFSLCRSSSNSTVDPEAIGRQANRAGKPFQQEASGSGLAVG